jgi:DNA-binding response OmpR family regulator
MRILILDDRPGEAEMLALNLRLAGHAAIGFTRSIEFLDAVREDDVLVAKYLLPEMNGLEVARQAFAQGWRGPLLLMSGHPAAMGEADEHPLPHLILHKPFPIGTLIESLLKSATNSL